MFKEVARFCLSGVVVIGVDFCVYYFLIKFFPFAVSKGVSFVCGGISSYFINKYWTFQRSQNASSNIIPFIIVNAAAFGMNVLINAVILGMFPVAVFPAWLVATLSTSVFIFFGFKFWVFK